MARVLGYGGLGNTNGARDFSGKEESTGVFVYRSRQNAFNRRRYAGLWRLPGLVALLLRGLTYG